MANIPGLLAAYNEISGSTGTHSSNTLASTANLPCIPEPVTFGTTIIDLKQKVVETLQTIENLASSILFVHSEIPTNEWALKTENNSRSLRARDTHGPLFSTLLWFESFEHCNFLALALSLAIILRVLQSRIRFHLDRITEDNTFIGGYTCFPKETSKGDSKGMLANKKINDDNPLVKYASFILRSVDYYFLPNNFGFSPFFFTLPLRMASMVLSGEYDLRVKEDYSDGVRLRQCTRELQMAERCLHEISAAKIAVGFDI